MALVPALVICLVFAPAAQAQSNTPSFDNATQSRVVPENTAAGEDIGNPVTASGGTGALTYSLSGPDSASFDIVATSGQIRTRDGVTYDHEAKSSYSVTVTATDTATMTATATVTITVTDVDEPPLAPPLVDGVGVPGTYDQIVIRWEAPDNTGRPEITGYEVEATFQFDPDSWGETRIVQGTELTITGLLPRSDDRFVRVRAKNDEGASPWVVPGGLLANFFLTPSDMRPLSPNDLPREVDRTKDLRSFSYQQWIPEGIGPGDSFRLLFATSDTHINTAHIFNRDGLFIATGRDAQYYYDDITSVAYSENSLLTFALQTQAVVSTRLVDAREITNTIYTDDYEGVPIFWFLGNKVADDYEDFWDGNWDEETEVRSQRGFVITDPGRVWTGSASDGTELIVNGVSHAVGQPQVGYGTPGSANVGAGPIHSGATDANTARHRLYGLTQVIYILPDMSLTNAGQFEIEMNRALAAIDENLPDAEYNAAYDRVEDEFETDTRDVRAQRRAQQFTTGPYPNGYELVILQMAIKTIGEFELGGSYYSLALYTVDGNGHPDARIVEIENPSTVNFEENASLSFHAPEGTFLSPNTAYAVVVEPTNPDVEVILDTTRSDNEDADVTQEGWSIADAFHIEGTGGWSAQPEGKSLLLRVRATPTQGPPGKPADLTATAMGRHRIDLSWTAPLDGGSEITGYRIESSSDGSTGWSDLVADTASTATSHSDTGLRPNTTHHYRVSAINALGTSPASDPAFDTTDDFPEVTVQYGQSDYTVAEGGTLEVTVTLSEDPLQTTVIPIAATRQDGATSADYSVPSSVTFGEGDTSKTITFAATDDTDDDDDESVLLSFGSVLPDKVSEGSPNEATVNIADDDDPHVTVMFAQADYVVVEGETILVRVALSADPERTVVIPLTATNQGGASSTDYSSVPSSVTLSAGETSRTFEFTASEDSFADTGESVKLGFGAMPDTRVSEGSPAEATVTIRQFSTEFTLDCSAAVWCADLQFSDQSQLDWGRARLEHGDNRDPASALSDDSFSFRGVEYEVRGFRLRAGTYPTLANAWSREEQNRSKFVILITPAGQSSAPSRAHYRDWVLHVDGLELPFKDVVNSQYGFFDWIDADIQQIFNDWTPTTVNKVGIQEVAAVDQPPSLAVPWLPMAVEAHGAGANELRVTWIPPLWHHRIPDPTGYIVQWKLASASWSAPAAVSQREVAGRHGRQVAIGGLAENTLYSVRVFPFNDAGDGPVSEDALGRTQRHSPDLLGMSVNGANLTLRYSRDLDPNSVPEATSFVVLADAGLREVPAVQVSGRDVTLTLAKPVNVFNYVQASYEEPNDPSATALQDTDDNRVESKTRLDGVEEVVNETPGSSVQPLTASFTNLPSSHDGAAVFTFNVEFSEPVWISLGLPRDDMLEVAGGTVTSALPVERSTELWEVTVLPETRGDIIVTLPGGFCTVVYDHATSDSPVPGAPCAVGDRALSNPPTVTIPGSESGQQIVQNTPAGGVPGIDGMAEVGQILSADTTNITDADGLDNVVFTYQWLADDVEIAGATASSHTLTDDDLGKPIRVRVTFTDDAGHDESLTSVPTAAVTAAEALELQAATVDGSTLTLTFDEALDTGVTLTASVFAVEVNGTPPSITGVGVGQSSVLLSLSPAVEAGATVTVDYTKPAGTDVIKDTLGREAESFSGEVVTNNTADEENVFRSEEPPPQKSQETAPEPPQNLTLEIHESGKLRATWNTPSSGPAPTGYTVQWKEAGGDWADSSEVSEAEVNMTSHVIRGLTDGVEYTVRVIATTDDAESAPSGEVTATPRETTPPGLSSATVDGATITLTFDEPLDTGETPDRSAFAVTVAGSGRGVDTVAVSGSVVTITLVTAVVAGDTVTLAYTAPTGDSSSRLQDLVGNAAASFSGQSVTNDTQAAAQFTASAHDVPAAHDGSTTFTFELRFSETPRKGFSYKTLRDHAFTVTSGDVTKARRLEKGKNVRWEIHVTPDGDGAVTVALPITTDCTAQGAVCTGDRRPLSNRLQLTVAGPGG